MITAQSTLQSLSNSSTLTAYGSEDIDAYALIDEVKEENKFTGKGDLIRIVVDVRQQSPWRSNKGQVKTIIETLMVQALRGADPSKRTSQVVVSVRVVPGFALIEIQDNGMGIPENEDLSGSSLRPVRLAVQKLKGKLTCRSARGFGSSYKVMLPFAVMDLSSPPIFRQ